MSIENNNKDNKDISKNKIIRLKQSEALKQNGLVIDSVYYTNTNDVKISLNHNTCANIIFTIDRKKWQNNLDIIAKQAEENGITETKNIMLLKSHLNDNHDEIIDINKTWEFIDSVKGLLNDNDDGGKEKSKQESFVYKYSKMGKGELHEAVIVNGLPFFIIHDNESNKFELLENIEENNRILSPPNLDGYPYTPYEFESNEELNLILEKARQITLDGLFKFSKSIFLRYVDQDEYIINLLAADAIWTYFQDLFPATHYGEGVGTNDVGKSSMGYTFEYTGYRVIKGTAISGANYSRVLGSIEPGQCVIIEDEGDNISEDPEKVKILKAGYEYNAKIPKINMNTTNQEQKWYFAYCYKMILAEKSLKEYKARGLVDRTFSFPMRPGKVKYAIKEVVSRNINKNQNLQKLYDELLCFRKLMLCYRLVHYKDELPEIETGLKNRDNELCKPLLQLFYGTESLKKEIIPTLKEFVKQRRTRKGNSLEAALYPIIKKYVFANAGLTYPTDTYLKLKEKLKEKEKKNLVKVRFSEIWDYIKEGGIDGQYDEKKNKYAYETAEYSTLYLNSLSTIISNKFAAKIKKQDYGKALIFDIEKLERFEDLYSDSHLKGDNVKIEVKLKPDNYDNYDNFRDVYTNILEKNKVKKEEKQAQQAQKLGQENNKKDIVAPQKLSESSELSGLSLIKKKKEDDD